MSKYRRLTRRDRIVIEKRLGQGKTQIEIAEELKVHRSTICRELKRNKAIHGPYRWRGAQIQADGAREYVIFYKRKISGVFEEVICELLEARLSPDQISKRLKVEDSKWSVSHETIYKWIYKVAPHYKKYLRWKSRCRQKRSGKPRRGIWKQPRKFISERPDEANSRLEPGHWERDLLEGLRGKPSLLVLQDRATRFTIIRKVRSKYSDEVNAVTAKALENECVISITNDNGVEFGNFEKLEEKLGVPVYFCHAYASWERGTVENTNGLIRQYYPKKTDFTSVTSAELQTLQDVINHRPRKLHGYRSPIEIIKKEKVKIIRSESYYRARMYDRQHEQFKRAMIEQVGYFLEKNGDVVVALNS